MTKLQILLEYVKKKEFFIVIICFILALLSFYPNIILGKAETYWLACFPLGGISLYFSIKSNKKILTIISIITLCSFFILMGIFSVADAIITDISDKGGEVSTTVVVLPEGTKSIHKGEIFNYTDKDNPEATLIFFGRTKCPSCKKFEDNIVSAIKKTSGTILYYNLDEMPSSETDLVISHFNIEHVPILAEVENSVFYQATGRRFMEDI